MSELILEQVRHALATLEPVCIRGGGTKDFYGLPSSGNRLETRSHTGVVSYEPTELVVSARAGTPLRELQAMLAHQGQCLAFEPPHFGDDATLGGCVAAGLAGPARQAVGGVRDFVLGAKVIDGHGQMLSFGGTVMKNVAGYDVSRLFCGSLGTLGVLLEVSLKVLPVVPATISLSFEMEEASAISILNRWTAQALPLTASAWHSGRLTVRLGGSQVAIKAAHSRLGGEIVGAAQAEQLWYAVREQTHDFFQNSVPLWRLSLPSSAPPADLPGIQFIEWGGALRWLKTDEAAGSIRARTQSLGGHATLFRADAATRQRVGVFTPQEPTNALIQSRIKTQFDPMGIFNRGRMYPVAHAPDTGLA